MVLSGSPLSAGLRGMLVIAPVFCTDVVDVAVLKEDAATLPQQIAVSRRKKVVLEIDMRESQMK